MGLDYLQLSEDLETDMKEFRNCYIIHSLLVKMCICLQTAEDQEECVKEAGTDTTVNYNMYICLEII